MSPQSIEEVLEFWFAPATRERWFDPSPEFDQNLRRRFGELYARAATGHLAHWENSADGSLALCILLDQMPRNIFRGDRRAFASDHLALRVAERALAAGHDRGLAPERRQFLYLPFMHSETLGHQLRCLALCEAAGLGESAKYARDHLAIIRRFGRFPHRNALLGRETTAEEAAYLAQNPDGYGQKAAADDPPA